MSIFVGVSTQLLSAEDLIKLLEKFATQPSYYFLRWTHAVSGFWQRRSQEFPELLEDLRDRITQHHLDATFPSPQGQMFNKKTELRWKQKGSSYEVLLLSVTSDELSSLSFQCIEEGIEWEIEERPASIYGSQKSSTETRFPKKFHYDELPIAQRYFKNKQTATVHFIALTVGKQK